MRRAQKNSSRKAGYCFNPFIS